MSPNDPKQTSARGFRYPYLDHYDALPNSRNGHEAARFHHAGRRRGGSAVRGTGTGAGADATHRRFDECFGRGLEGQSYVAAFQQGMQELGWSVGRNLRIDLRWGGDSSECWRRYANELVGLSPDAIVAAGGVLVANLQRASRTIPIVFAQSIDPVGAGIVASLARPGGNATGFAQFEYSLSAKWAELLKDITPGLKRVGDLREPANAAGIGQWAIIQAAASAAGMEVFPLSVRDPGEIERGIAAFAGEPNGGLVIAVGSSTTLIAPQSSKLRRGIGWRRSILTAIS